MAQDRHFEMDMLEQTMDLLLESNDGEMRQLSAALRSLHKILLFIWSTSYDKKTELMKKLSRIELKKNDVANLLHVHNKTK